MKSLEQNFESLLRPRELYGKKGKITILSSFVQKISPKNKSDCFLFSNFVFQRYWRTQNFEILSHKGTSHTNSDSEWGNTGNASFVQQISHRINLVAL
jgi:hypothetical protein